jgi:pimeloyl-ACP methyl ester carboxylesterase
MKKTWLIVLALLALVILIPVMLLGPYALRVQHFTAVPASGYHADFYLYISPKAKQLAQEGKVITIIVQPNNSGISSDDPKEHQRDSWITGYERQKIADELGVVLLVPAFIRPGEDWFIYTHALDRDTLITEREDLKRIDLQLIAMIDHARLILAESGINTDERVFIQGFSASGMFANRFTILHPERVKAAAIGSPGGFPILPVKAYGGESLSYPAGIANIEELTGKPFDAKTYNAIPQLIYMGDLDDNDSLDYSDGWEEETASVVDSLFGAYPLSRWNEAQVVYKEEGANVQFLLVKGVGHDRKALQGYALDFFKGIMEK